MPDTSTTNSLTSASVNVLANDYFYTAGTNTVSLIAGSVSSGSALVSGNNIIYTPLVSFTGKATLQYKVLNNTTGLTDTALVTVLVSFSAPAAYDDSVTINSGGNASVNVATNDTDPYGTGINAIVINGPKYGSYSQSGNTISYNAPFNFIGRDTITYRLINAAAGSCNETNVADTAFLIIKVLNRQPVAVPDSANTNPCQAIVIDVLKNDSDPENGSITIASISSVSPLAAGTATVSSNLIYFNSNPSYAGSSATITYTINDDANPQATSSAATVTINMNNIVNLPPNAKNDTISGLYNSDTFISVLDNDSDPENDPITVSLPVNLLQPSHGTVSVLGNGIIVYTPNTSFSGTDSFGYKISDTHFGPSGASCTSVSQSATAKAYVVIVNSIIVLAQNHIFLSGSQQEKQNLLTWSVKEDDIPATYILERSTDGRLFGILSTVYQTNNISSIRKYEYIDRQPFPATFYRIKMIRGNQPVVYSNTLMLRSAITGNNPQIYPVPFMNEFSINILTDSENKIKVTLYNSQGAVIRQKSFNASPGNNILIFDQLHQLPYGVYNVVVQDGQLTYKQKIMKSN
jgi:hypothetical protein